MEKQELIPHLFRTEYRKIISVLCRRFGFAYVETAEDIASDTFAAAAQTWSINGIPDNPAAWLYNVAKNKARNYLHRESIFGEKVAPAVKKVGIECAEFDIDLSPQSINDSQLLMMFAICNPSISPEAQVGLSLRILCGFGIDEIAEAFLTNKETINKRLFRAKQRLREENIKIDVPGSTEIEKRLDAVLTTIYLLFSEGYYSINPNYAIRRELCLEAMRLCYMLIENKSTDQPRVNALLALMCFHASRFDARLSEEGDIILYDEQDCALWNAELISRGVYFLNRGSTGPTISKYHLEAAIAYWSTQQADTKEKWENILQLYDQLLQIEYSPVAVLNRTFALSKANGKKEAIMAAEMLNLRDNRFFFALLGELYTGADSNKAAENFQTAMSMAKNAAERHAIQKKLNKLHF
ncbi:MAG: RNA polymerase sigma factor [Mucilaginibacter sp.]